MKKQAKSHLLLILFIVTITCFCFGLLGCKDQGKGSINFADITFLSQTVDVGDAPDFVVEIGDNKITQVIVDGKAIAQEDYIVKNGYFAFAYENFKQMGLGQHSIKVVFENGSKEFTITVTDSQDAKFEVSVSENYEIGDTLLPKATILNDYQDFSISYSLTKNGEAVELTDNGNNFAVSFFEVGNYKYVLSVTKGGQTIDHVYNINVRDSFEYVSGKNYVEKDLIKYFSGTVSCSWDEERGAIKASEYLGISNELIHRARYSGDNYLQVTLSTDISNPSYGTFPYVATDKKSVSFSGQFYATDGLQTIIIDLNDIESTEGVTEIAKGGSGLPIYIYSAVFTNLPLNDNVNYAAHAYKSANIWTASDGDGTPWDYRVGDYMELWTYKTIMVKTSLFKQAISLGYTHIIYEAENSSTNASLYYNEQMNANQSDLTDGTANNSVAFVNGRACVAMDIRELANSNKEWVFLAGVNTGKLLTINLTFTNKPITNAVVTYNEVESTYQRVELGGTFDMTKFGVKIAGQSVSDFAWTLNGTKVDMTNTALRLEEGIYTLKATLNGESGRGVAVCSLSVVRPIESSEIQGELVSEEKMYLWQSGGEFRYNSKYIAQAELSLSAMAILRAKEEGKNYLEVTAIATNGWLSVYLNPGAQTQSVTSNSTFDGMHTYVIDLTNVVQNDGFVKLFRVNEFTVTVTSAKFIDKPVTSNVNYAQWGYASSGIISVTNGKEYSVNDIEELKNIFDPLSELWKTFMVAKAGSFAIDKDIVQDALASGFTKVRLDIIGVNGASTVYYPDKLSSTAITSSAVNSSTFTNSRVSVTIDITNLSSVSGNIAYLAGTNAGWLVLEGLYFGE